MKECRILKVSRLRELFTYDPITGEVRRLTGRNAGKACGKASRTGHMSVKIEGREVGVHRTAWALTHGEYPTLGIDHINGNPSDNYLANLRLATVSQNSQNSRLSARNKTGVKNVHRVKCRKNAKWRVSIGLGKGKYYEAHFYCFGKAVKHASQMRRNFYGEFARAA